MSDIALRRAARNDGWIGDLIGLDQAVASIDRIREPGTVWGWTVSPSSTPLIDAYLPEHYQRASDAGIDAILTMPWMFLHGPERLAGGQDRRDAQGSRTDLGLDG